MASTGSVTLNGITDVEMVRIWEFKAKDGNKFVFQPNQMQPINHNNNPQQFSGKYNNVIFSWSDDVGMSVVHEILAYLLKKEQQAMVVGQ